MHYHIILTELCNMNCKYCYEKSMHEFENGLEKRWNYEDSPVDSEVDVKKLKKFVKSEDTLIFYGGEPLLKLEKIKEIMDNLNCKFCIQTNGKLLNLIPKKYLKRFSRILVSLDGTFERDKENKGEGHYDLVLKNIQDIGKKGFEGEVVARMTIILPDIFEQVKHLIELKEIDSVHWQIDAGFYKNDFDEGKFSYFVEEYNKSLTKLIDFWVKNIKQGKVLKFYPFLGIFESLYYGKKTRLRCGAGYANFTITTNGKLSACPIMNSVKNFYCGSIEKGITKEIFCIEPCNSCECYDLCGGRCLYSNYAKLWPKKGQDLICKTVIHLIKEMKRVLPEIKKSIKENQIQEKDFEYEKYFGPEIIP